MSLVNTIFSGPTECETHSELIRIRLSGRETYANVWASVMNRPLSNRVCNFQTMDVGKGTAGGVV